MYSALELLTDIFVDLSLEIKILLANEFTYEMRLNINSLNQYSFDVINIDTI